MVTVYAETYKNNFFFFIPEAIDCQFCQGINNITVTKVNDPEVQEMLNAEEPFLLEDVKDYYDANIGFKDLKEMFEKNPAELDDAVCNIKKAEEFKSISEFFKKVPDEKAMNDKGFSIEWYCPFIYYFFICNILSFFLL